jgi:hypothetical protein
MNLDDLIERLEKATGPDRDLFITCYLAVNNLEKLSDGVSSEACKRYLRFLNAEAWIDAALTLVPEGWWPFAIYFGTDGKGPCEAILFRRRDQCKIGGGYSHTKPAIALCIAALKARKSLEVEK